ncbi:hypothetical protein C8Q79DRAFT_922702 [Trametes meyenii]|nr:hypothetical protein C8Q79DRAFT_922702 [Trametes meyenii]
MRDEFDEDPQAFCDSVIDGRQSIDHNNWPSMMYTNGLFDPDAVDMGLCRGSLLLKALRHIFTSPSSVNKPPGKKSQGRGCIAQMYKLDTVEPENIAYVAALTRSLLSASTCWEDEDGTFEAETFYSNVVRLFKDDINVDDDWVAETLSWWNSGVYGHSATGRLAAGAVMRQSGLSQVDLLRQQRAARAAARHASTQPQQPPQDSFEYVRPPEMSEPPSSPSGSSLSFGAAPSTADI